MREDHSIGFHSTHEPKIIRVGEGFEIVSWFNDREPDTPGRTDG
jgi:hypothetical protein